MYYGQYFLIRYFYYGSSCVRPCSVLPSSAWYACVIYLFILISYRFWKSCRCSKSSMQNMSCFGLLYEIILNFDIWKMLHFWKQVEIWEYLIFACQIVILHCNLCWRLSNNFISYIMKCHLAPNILVECGWQCPFYIFSVLQKQ